MTLSDEELEQVLSLVSPTGTDYQAGRICRLLATGSFRTGVIAGSCSVGNLADVIRKNINPKITDLGLFVSCVRPTQEIKNQFGQKAGDWIYSFYSVKQEAANDDLYVSADDWEEQLNDVPELAEGS